jgi:hypothetical protein
LNHPFSISPMSRLIFQSGADPSHGPLRVFEVRLGLVTTQGSSCH